MKRIILSLLLSAVIYGAIAQATQEYRLDTTATPVSNSYYSHLTVIDGRMNPDLGYIQTGAFNTYRILTENISLKEQMTELFLKTIDNTAKDGNLILYLRNFSFAEITKATSEKGYFSFAADLYGSIGTGYILIEKMDTVVVVKGLDVTKKMLAESSNFYKHFIASALSKLPAGSEILSTEDIANTVTREKRKLPLYNVDTFTNGIYYSYETFKHQQPDYTNFELKYAGDMPMRISDKTTNKKITNTKNIYAIVDNNRIFLNTVKGFVPASKVNDDIVFKGYVNVNADQKDALVTSIMFGAIGAIIASSNNVELHDLMLDYNTGKFISAKNKSYPLLQK